MQIPEPKWGSLNPIPHPLKGIGLTTFRPVNPKNSLPDTETLHAQETEVTLARPDSVAGARQHHLAKPAAPRAARIKVDGSGVAVRGVTVTPGPILIPPLYVPSGCGVIDRAASPSKPSGLIGAPVESYMER